MSCKKPVLIYMENNNIKPTGGPSGYIYNLKQEFDKRKIDNIHFISSTEFKSRYRNLYSRLPKTLKELYKIIARYKYYRTLLSNSPKKAKAKLDEYDVIHFHSSIKMYSVKDSLRNYNGIVVLTSHTPKPAHREIIEDQFTPLEKLLFRNKYERIREMEEYAFNRADYIVFPCEQAEEPYVNNWSGYTNIKEANRRKYRYLLTGTTKRSVRRSRQDIYSLYGIPEDAIIISYVGRHNKTKGYDQLKILGEKVLETNPRVYFLVAGAESPLRGLKHERWVEVGWTNDPHSLMAASNIFVLPNKETYFDLIMLEALSLGTIVLASNTGGNKYFGQFYGTGIYLYDDMENAYDQLTYLINLSNVETEVLRQRNVELFEDRFDSSIFCTKYLELIDRLEISK